MATRTRLVLRYPNGCTYTGVAALAGLGAHVGSFKALPGNTKAEKLMAAGKLLPVGCELLLIQEPKRTRRMRSLYWKVRMKEAGN
jgi:hypothetical protein